MNTIKTSQPIYKKHNGIGLKPTKELASIFDLNNHMFEMSEKGTLIFYHKFDYLTLKEGVFKKREDQYCVTYEKIK